MKKFNKKEYDKNYKSGKCKDCGTKIWYGSIRCKSCARKYQYATRPETHPFFGLKENLSPNWKGGWRNFCIDCGKKIDFNAKRCRHHARIYQYKNPENHPQWLGGKSFEPYSIEWTEELREFIRKRDNYICQNCGLTNEEHLIVYDRELSVHHIDYNKQNCSEENLITVCNQCNSRANYNRNYWQEIYKNKVLSLIKERLAT